MSVTCKVVVVAVNSDNRRPFREKTLFRVFVCNMDYSVKNTFTPKCFACMCLFVCVWVSQCVLVCCCVWPMLEFVYVFVCVPANRIKCQTQKNGFIRFAKLFWLLSAHETLLAHNIDISRGRSSTFIRRRCVIMRMCVVFFLVCAPPRTTAEWKAQSWQANRSKNTAFLPAVFAVRHIHTYIHKHT